MSIPYSYAIAIEKEKKEKKGLNQTTHMIVPSHPPKNTRASVGGGGYFYTRYCKAKATRTPVAAKVIADEAIFSPALLEGPVPELAV